ncbi:hypothetical protein [Peribacillus simplex]|uniref:Uncharacterized protein n=1 Tax=Peribacillus simplex TaxID=1478 RepID=A0A9W4PEY6_9BACI|nr:hypothetical protein [Peribacillus simplex]CAH0186995.1 hypothetical protein SRABI133_01570 [Peribacillus simplex]
MCAKCNDLKHTHTEVITGVWQVTPCSCLPDWEMTRKPQHEQILKEARERYERYGIQSDQERGGEVLVSQAT